MTTAGDRRRVALADALLAAGVGALGLVDAFSDRLSVHGPGSSALGAVGVLASAALLSQRRLRPHLVLGVYLVWMGLGVLGPGGVPSLFYGTLVPLLLATYSASRHGQGRVPWLAAVLCLAALAWAHLTLPALGGWSGLAFNVAAAAAAFSAGWGLRRSEERAVADALRAEREEAAARRAIRAAVADERARIARDLHDVLGHSMSAMVVQAGAAEQAVGVDAEVVRRALRDIRSTGTGALDEVRRVVALLREPADVTGPTDVVEHVGGAGDAADLAAAQTAGGSGLRAGARR